jgi:hypothetical protein
VERAGKHSDFTTWAIGSYAVEIGNPSGAAMDNLGVKRAIAERAPGILGVDQVTGPWREIEHGRVSFLGENRNRIESVPSSMT